MSRADDSHRDPDEIPELPEDVDPVADAAGTESAPGPGAPAAAKAPGASAAAPAAPGERPPLRELDQAPRHLRVAAGIVVVGSLVPWMGHDGGWVTAALAKVLVLAGAWLWYQQVKHVWGPPLGGVLGKLAGIVLKPKPEEGKAAKRPRRAAAQEAPVALEHPFPTGLHVLSLFLILAACVGGPLVDPAEGVRVPIAAAELGMLAWAACTWVHIFAYERWGRFNPLFPLMFLGMVFAGVTRVIAAIGLGLDTLPGVAAAAGGAIVAAGGGLAAYTIVEALRQAKKEGDEKKKAAAEARRAARGARRSSSRG